jgi:tetratricopeptide (TPR) repeat protein
MGHYAAAIDAFDRGLEFPGDHRDLIFQRALAKRAAGDLAGALADLDVVLNPPHVNVQAILLRGECHRQAGDLVEAERDRALGLSLAPRTVSDWLARGLALCPGQPTEALAAFREAERLQPHSLEALQNRAYVEAELLHQADAAIRTLDRALELRPDYVPSLMGRAVLLARSGVADIARRDADRALRLQPDGATTYQAGCVYALTSPDEPSGQSEAIRLVLKGLALGFGRDLIDTDPDLDNLRKHPQFELVRAYQHVIAPRAMQPTARSGDSSHDVPLVNHETLNN